jgi:uncharacterized protein
MRELLTALGLVLVIEGLLYALVPGHLKHLVSAIAGTSEDRLRFGGVMAVAVGVGLVWLVRAF